MLPNSIKKISLFLERLPGIGQKTANRLAFYFLRLPERDLKDFAETISTLKEKIKFCSNCFNLTEEKICGICANKLRDQTIVTVVESVLDLLSFETGNIYNGIYHVLHGRIDPLNHIGPDDIRIKELIDRIKTSFAKASAVKEVILATNPDMEGEATAMFIRNQLNELKDSPSYAKASAGKQVNELKITRLAYGLPIGANLEYADYMTLKKAIDGRNKF